ncbi:Nucleoid occlusion protein [bacterium YEK0313]|nr:Nucleoid occlusion protein [bacterium YEK0313]
MSTTGREAKQPASENDCVERYAPRGGDRNGKFSNVEISGIHIPNGRRPVDTASVERLKESIQEIGLINPPVVRFVYEMLIDGEECRNVPVLVAGRHRIEALKLLGHEWVSCLCVEADDPTAEMMEIGENLHRAELSALEHDLQLARWIELAEGRRLDTPYMREPRQAVDAPHVEAEKPAQIAPVSRGGRGKRSGVNSASRELGVDRTAAQRAVRVASLSAEAKSAAHETGLENNRSALLAAAKEREPEKQVAVLERWSARLEPEDSRSTKTHGADDDAALHAFEKAWGAVPAHRRGEALLRIGVTVSTAKEIDVLSRSLH